MATMALPSRLQLADIGRAARALRCEPEAVLAVLRVETAGRGGLLADGRPRILFEAHLFSRFTGGRYDGVHPRLSAPAWDRRLYAGGAGEWTRLEAAAALDRPAALRACSWGLFQILGDNHRLCGFDQVEDFVDHMQDGEGAQLDIFVAFILRRRLDDELREQRWADFARLYNGPGYAANQYDAKLAREYADAKANGVRLAA